MNITKHAKLQAAALLITTSLAGYLPGSVQAAPGTLSDTPLFLSTAVQPNIMFMIDDSGSMLWGDLLNAGTYSPGAAILSDSAFFNPPGAYSVDWNRRLARLFCRGFNVMAYDPNVLYTPWVGVDSASNAYGNLTLTTARSNPYNTTPINISAHYYWAWNDADSDGAYDGPTDPAFWGGDPSTPTDECGNVSTLAGGVAVNSLPATGTFATPNSQQNYANWYSYYRRREFVAKRALSEIITDSDARVGLATLHDNNSVRTLVKDIDDISLPVNATAQADKLTLLDNLFQVTSSGGTPLRQGLEDTGEYYEDGGTWDPGNSPILPVAQGGECQQNFAVVMSDGFWNGGAPNVGDADSDNNTAFDGGSYADGSPVSNTLADVAMDFYERDLSNISDKVPTSTIDPNDQQHMVTYTVAFGINGTVTADPLPTDTSFNWPTPVSNALTTVDDMRHAAWNGRGEFLSAQDPTQLINSLQSAIGSIQGRVGSAASVAFNSGSLSTNSEVYLALFNSERWSGDLLAYPLDPLTGVININPVWSAADVLDARNLSTTPRTMLTFDGTDGTALQWANLTVPQKDDFRTNSGGTPDDDATATARLGHFRGDRDCEVSSTTVCSYTMGANTFTAKSLRERDSRLGDILHSGPVFAGAPESNWPDIAPFPNSTGSTYSEYRTSQAGRMGVIYAGGNDGMLHAFAQASGDEILAYVPNTLFSTNIAEGLHYLSDPGYSHRYYVDQTPSVADAHIKTTTAGSVGWKTVLVGALRGGGRGLYALDISNPSAYSETGSTPADIVMWEFSNADDADLGFTFSRPSIIPLQASAGGIRWAAVFGNGYNDTGDGEAKLFILFIEDGLDGTWSGTDYVEITTGAGTPANRNGLSTPAIVDSDGDGLADRAYAGDLQGNMWVFDLSGFNTGNWGVAYTAGTTPKPLFTAPANQQITETPVIVRNSDIPTVPSNAPNTLVMFGTGQYLTTADITTTNVQTMYGVWDSGTDSLTQANLIAQTIGVGTTTGGAPGRTLTSNTVDYATDFGWYMDFPTSGERSITDPVIRGDLVFFNTTIPDADPCNFGGTGWLMVAKWIDGSHPDAVAFDLNGDAKVDSLDEINGAAAAGMQVTGLPTSPVNLGNKRYVATTETTSGATIEMTEIEDIQGPSTGRLSWEEIEL